MARVDYIEADTLNGRVYSGWEENGYQFRSNILLWVGAKVPLHSHSYDHIARIQGRMKMTVENIVTEVLHGEEIFIPVGKQHTFELLEAYNEIGEVLCFWRAE